MTLHLPQTNIHRITEEKSTLTADEVSKFHAMSLSGILLLARLQDIEPSLENEQFVTILTCLASFTNLDDPWTCSKASDHACSLLRGYTASESISAVFTSLLHKRIKPLFSRPQNPAVIQQGRGATDPISGCATIHSDLDKNAKPWKYRDAYGVTVFQWVVKHIDVRITGNS